MLAVGTERQRIDRRHGGDRERSIEMGEKLIAARFFPSQGRTQPVGGHAQQHKAGLPCPMLRGAAHDLGSCRKMDEAVGGILRGAGIAAGEFGGNPFRIRMDGQARVHTGDALTIGIDPSRASLFDLKTEERL